MNCKKCNAELVRGNAICPECGTDNTKTNSNRGLVVVLAVCCVVVGALVAVLIISLMKPAETPVTTTAPTTSTTPNTTTAATLPADLVSYTADDDTVAANADVVIATAGEYELTVGELQIYYWSSVYNFLNQYSYYLTYFGLDYSKPLDQQIYDQENGTTWQQFFLDGAINTWHRYQVMVHMADEADFQVSDEVQSYFDSLSTEMEDWAKEYGYESVQEMISHDFGSGASYEDYEAYLKLYYTSYEFFEQEYEAVNATSADVEAYYTAHEEDLVNSGSGKDAGNSVDVRHVLIQPEGGVTDDDGITTYTDEAWEAARVKAQSLLDAWLTGEATEETFAQMAVAHSADGNAAQGGLYQGITSGTSFVEEFLDWCMDESRQVGDSGLVKTQFGYHIMYFSATEPIWYVTAEDGLRTDTVNERVEAETAKLELKRDDEKILLSFVDLAATE